jgi:hypothetical protein
MQIEQFVDEFILNSSVFTANVLLDVVVKKGEEEVTFKVDASYGADDPDPRTGIRMERVSLGYGSDNLMINGLYYVANNKSYRGDFVSGLKRYTQYLVTAVESTKNKNVMNYYRQETEKAMEQLYKQAPGV